MFNHEPGGYRCPLCYVSGGKEEDNFPQTRQADVVYRDEFLTAFIGSRWWPNNKGHVIIIPNKHYENIFDLPEEFAEKIAVLSKKIALALKSAYQCDGITTRQHNEPAGSQDVWHYHLHIFPRYENDNFYKTTDDNYLSDPQDRLEYATKLRALL